MGERDETAQQIEAIMATEAQGEARMLNPFVLHLEKLGLELKCPICLGLMNKPISLPCNHIFCNACVPKSHQFRNQCRVCRHHFMDKEIRHVYHMENIAAIYKSLKATFNTNILPMLSAETKAESMLTGPRMFHSAEGLIELSNKVGTFELSNNGHSKESERQRGYVMTIEMNAQKNPLDVCPSKENVAIFPVIEELDVNQAPESSPGSSPSLVHDTAPQNSNQGCKAGSKEASTGERSVGSGSDVAFGGADYRNYPEESCHPREPKRQKKLTYSEPVIRSHGCTPKRVSESNETAISKPVYHSFKDKTSVVPTMGICSASDVNARICAFCHTSIITEDTGPMVHYANGKEVTGGKSTFSKAISVHRICIDWTPRVYYSKGRIKNLESELTRASKLKCSSCGLKGAALGCFAKSCRRTYHVPCALEISDCRWDCDNFLMLCAVHRSIPFPNEKFNSGKQDSEDNHTLSSPKEPEGLKFWATSHNGPQEWVFCGSALSSEEKCLMIKFGEICGAPVYKFWDPSVTHVIAATDNNGACCRTLKVLMAILNGRWVLTIDWVRACMEANSPVSEEPYEVNLDNHGFLDGPRTGRLKSSSNAPRLFDGLGFYFSGDFVPAYKSDLLDLVLAGGGTIIEKIEPIFETRPEQHVSTCFVVYNRDLPQVCMAGEAKSLVLKRLGDAKDTAEHINAQVIPHTWILESAAACKMLP